MLPGLGSTPPISFFFLGVFPAFIDLDMHWTDAGEAGSGESGSAGRVRQRKGRRKERAPISTHAELVEATRAQLEASFGSGAKPPWADADTPEQALQTISAL